MVALLGVSCSDTKTPTGVLPTRTVDAGSVDVTITPTRFDAQGATFAIVLDTHAVELSMDLAASAVLDVDGSNWPSTGWSGDGPGGHHRTGELRFDPAGAARGTAHLTIAGFSKPVEATWELGG
jgi:hypothetical protein